MKPARIPSGYKGCPEMESKRQPGPKNLAAAGLIGLVGTKHSMSLRTSLHVTTQTKIKSSSQL